MRINVPECLTPYIERLKGNSKGAWLGRLREKTDNPNYITGYVNKGFAKWCKEQELERFTFYAFRKSWGTIARRIGIEKAIVDEGLVHVGDYQMTDIYAERPWERINEANMRVLELFKWD
jgi:integrase